MRKTPLAILAGWTAAFLMPPVFAGSETPPPRAVTVRADTFFNATGIFVDSGHSFIIQANGVVDLSVGNGGYQTDPNGTIVIAPPATSGAFQFFRDRAGGRWIRIL